MEPTAASNIRESLEAARNAARAANFDGCDMDDLDEIMEAVEQELAKPSPNPQTLTTYLNSLARSLRASASTRSACLQLDAAMRSAGLSTDWEH